MPHFFSCTLPLAAMLCYHCAFPAFVIFFFDSSWCYYSPCYWITPVRGFKLSKLCQKSFVLLFCQIPSKCCRIKNKLNLVLKGVEKKQNRWKVDIKSRCGWNNIEKLIRKLKCLYLYVYLYMCLNLCFYLCVVFVFVTAWCSKLNVW